MKIIVLEREKKPADGLYSRLVNLERISEMENRFDELDKIQHREKKDGKCKREVKIYEGQN